MPQPLLLNQPHWRSFLQDVKPSETFSYHIIQMRHVINISVHFSKTPLWTVLITVHLYSINGLSLWEFLYSRSGGKKSCLNEKCSCVFFFFLSFPDHLSTVQPCSRQTSFIGKSVWLNVGANCFSHVSELCKAMEKNEGHRQKSCLGSKKAGGHYVGDISMN